MLLVIKICCKVLGETDDNPLGQEITVFNVEIKTVVAKYTFYFPTGDNILWIALLRFFHTDLYQPRVQGWATWMWSAFH